MFKSPFIKLIIALAILLQLFTSISFANEKKDLFLREKIAVGRSYYKNGEFEKAYYHLKKLFHKSPGNMTINFLMARSAFELKKYEEAIFIYERIIISHPNLLRVKLEMGRTYMILGTNEEAKRLFFEVLDQNPPFQVRKNIKRLLKIIEEKEEKHRFYSSIQFGAGYDDNVNTSPTDQVIEIPAFGNLPMTISDDESDSFLSSAIDFNYKYSLPFQTYNTISTSFSYMKNNYFSVDEQNLDFFNFDLLTDYTITSASKISGGLKAQHIRVDNKSYMNLYGLQGRYKKRINKDNSISVYSSIFIKDYTDYSMQKANNGSIEFSWMSKINNFVFTPTGGISKEFADFDVYSYLRYSAGLSISYIPIKTLACNLSYKFQNSSYEDYEPLFNEKREDNSNFITADINWVFFISKNTKASSSIGLSHIFIKNSSNIKVYEYDKNKTTLYVKYNF